MNNTSHLSSVNKSAPTKPALSPNAVPISFLNARRLPARLNKEQAATVLGFQDHDIAVLIRKQLLKPLGNSGGNCVKYFAAVEIERLARDANWLDHASAVISRRK